MSVTHARLNTGILSWRRRCLLVSCLCVAALVASSCARAHARITPEVIPPLDMPLPPPRLVEAAAEPAPPEPMTLPPEPARTVPPTPRPRTPPAPAPQATEASKPEPPKAPEEPKAQAPTTLRTAPTEQEAQLERRTRGLLLEGTSNLNRIDYGRLSADAKVQYDSAKAFVRQAEEALRSNNLVFASYLADKAATLAAQLRGQ